jgi:hypothetical protein
VFSAPSVRTLFFKTLTKQYRAVAKRRGAYAAITHEVRRFQGVPKAFSGLSLESFLCVLRANPVFQDKYKSVSRRREKKGRLRRDDHAWERTQ